VWLLIPKSFRLHCSNNFELFVASMIPEAPKSRVNLHHISVGECNLLDPRVVRRFDTLGEFGHCFMWSGESPEVLKFRANPDRQLVGKHGS
jgi:hypothetical protein